jgi:hypothetical protein
METEAKYHHLIPQTYMRGSWKHGVTKNSRVYSVDKGVTDVGSSVKTKDIGGIEDYHSIRVDSLIATNDDCVKFFEPLKNYQVLIENKIETDLMKLNQNFYEYDSWIIQDDKGNIVSETQKNTLKKDILSIHVKYIEVEWSHQYENYWNSTKDAIIAEIDKHPNQQKIPSVKREELTKFMVSMDWRTLPYPTRMQELMDFFLGQKFLGADLKQELIPEDDRLYPFLKTVYDEFSHSYLLKQFKKFLQGNGPIMNEAINIINNMGIILLLAPQNGEFITSDNPVCWFTNSNGDKEYIFPITPNVACSLKKGISQTEYIVQQLTKNELISINNKLKNNCHEFYILREQNLSLYYFFSIVMRKKQECLLKG